MHRKPSAAASFTLALGLLAGCESEQSPALIGGYSRTDDARVILVHFTTGTCDEVAPPAVTETAQAVTITVLVKVAGPDTPCTTLAPKRHTEKISLQSELGSRAVRGPKQDTDVQLVPATPR